MAPSNLKIIRVHNTTVASALNRKFCVLAKNNKDLIMVKQHKKTTANADVDMTPMLDIVFILLIFFIVTTSFVKEHAIEINRPLAKPTFDNPKKQAQFTITENDSIYFANRLITPEQIIANLALFTAQFEMTNVQVTASEQSSHKTMVTLLDKIKQYQDVPISIGTSL